MIPSFILMIWLGIASQLAKSQGFVHNQMKSFSTANCSATINSTLTETPVVQEYAQHVKHELRQVI